MEDDSELDNNYLRRGKKWFKACINDNSNNEGFIKIQEILQETGGLSMRNTETKWQDIALYYTRKFGENAFFDIDLNEDNLLTVRIIYYTS